MATQAQINANRRNSARSTGPKSVDGKHIVSRNALRHGLRSNDELIPGEDLFEYEAFRIVWERELAPEGIIEQEMADQIISLSWRLRRVRLIEAALHWWKMHTWAIKSDWITGIVPGSKDYAPLTREQSRDHFDACRGLYRSWVGITTQHRSLAPIGSVKDKERAELERKNEYLADHNAERGWFAKSWDVDLTAKLEGYEASLEKRFHKAIRLFEERRDRRWKMEGLI